MYDLAIFGSAHKLRLLSATALVSYSSRQLLSYMGDLPYNYDLTIKIQSLGRL